MRLISGFRASTNERHVLIYALCATELNFRPSESQHRARTTTLPYWPLRGGAKIGVQRVFTAMTYRWKLFLRKAATFSLRHWPLQQFLYNCATVPFATFLVLRHWAPVVAGYSWSRGSFEFLFDFATFRNTHICVFVYSIVQKYSLFIDYSSGVK